MDYGLWYGDMHEGRSIPALSHWFLPPTLLIDGCPTLLVKEYSGYTLRTTTVWMVRRVWGHVLGVGGWFDAESLSSYEIGDTFCSIIDVIYILHGAVLIIPAACQVFVCVSMH